MLPHSISEEEEEEEEVSPASSMREPPFIEEANEVEEGLSAMVAVGVVSLLRLLVGEEGEGEAPVISGCRPVSASSARWRERAEGRL